MIRTAQIKNLIVRGARSALGKGFVDSQMLRRNFAFYKRHEIIFIHVPKCAGSSVSQAIYGQSLGHWPASRLMSHDEATFRSLPSFAVLRDPVSRARSAWSYARSGGTAEGWVRDRPEYREPSFETFEAFATQWLPARDPASLDHVFRPQSLYVTGAAGQPIVSQLIALPELEERFAGLVAGTKALSPALPRKNRNSQKSQSEVTPKAAAAIREIYRDDIALYGSLLS